MHIYYCPNCGNVMEYGRLQLMSKGVRSFIKNAITEGRIKEEEQRLCIFCEGMGKKQLSIPQHEQQISYCKSCSDLEYKGIWQRFDYLTKGLFKGLIEVGRLRVDSVVEKCPTCIDNEKFVVERKANLYNDSYKPFRKGVKTDEQQQACV